MSELGLGFILLGGALVTYSARLSFIALVPQDRLPGSLRGALRYVPPAVLSALILPGLIAPYGPIELSLHNPRLLAGLAAGLVALRFRNMWLTIAVGMVILWALTSL